MFRGISMAFVSVIIGGLVGFGSFLSALFVYDMGFFWSLTIYSGTGIATTLLLITLLLIGQSPSTPQPREVATRQGAPIHKRAEA